MESSGHTAQQSGAIPAESKVRKEGGIEAGDWGNVEKRGLEAETHIGLDPMIGRSYEQHYYLWL